MKVYEERVFSKWLVIILSTVTLALALSWILAGFPFDMIIAVLVLLLAATLNCLFIRITLTDSYVRVSYGILSARRSWKDVVAVEQDGKHYFYGYGIRLGRYRKKWVWVFNTVGDPRVVFITKNRFGLIVSTKHPEKVVQVSMKFVKK